MNKVWILTEEYNEYDQHGEYFLAVFAEKPTAEKPTVEKLIKIGVHESEVEHVLSGGGRMKNEHQWYHLKEEVLL